MLRLAACALALVAAAPAFAQTRAHDEPRPSANALVGQTVGTTDVTVTYGRPLARGRTIFGDTADVVVPYGKVWRTGANEATTVTVSDTVHVEGEALAPGTYALFTVPGHDEWTVIFNRVAEQWGAFRYDEAQDALRVTVEPQTEVPMHEQFEIRFTAVSDASATMTLHWDRTGVPILLEDRSAVVSE